MGISNMADERLQRYTEIIIEHSQFPRHHGSIDAPTHQGKGENPFCGDRITLQFVLGNDGVINEVAVASVGCAISIASGSLLAAHLQGLTLAQADALFAQTRAAITTGPDAVHDETLGELAALAFAHQYPSRVKCATLPWHVLKHVLAGDGSVATTE